MSAPHDVDTSRFTPYLLCASPLGSLDSIDRCTWMRQHVDVIQYAPPPYILCPRCHFLHATHACKHTLTCTAAAGVCAVCTSPHTLSHRHIHARMERDPCTCNAICSLYAECACFLLLTVLSMPRRVGSSSSSSLHILCRRYSSKPRTGFCSTCSRRYTVCVCVCVFALTDSPRTSLWAWRCGDVVARVLLVS